MTDPLYYSQTKHAALERVLAQMEHVRIEMTRLAGMLGDLPIQDTDGFLAQDMIYMTSRIFVELKDMVRAPYRAFAEEPPRSDLHACVFCNCQAVAWTTSGYAVCPYHVFNRPASESPACPVCNQRDGKEKKNGLRP